MQQANQEWSATYKAMVFQAKEDSRAFAEELNRRERRFAEKLDRRKKRFDVALAEGEAARAADRGAAATAAAAAAAALATEVGDSERRVAELAYALERSGVEAAEAAAAAATAAAADTARLLEEAASTAAVAAAARAVTERVHLAEALDEMRLRLGAVKTVLDANTRNLQQSHAVNRLNVAVFSLTSAAAAGAPLTDEVAQVRVAVVGPGVDGGEGDALIAAVLTSMPAAAAASGVPTAAALADRLVDVSRAARALVLVPGGGGGLLAHAAAASAAWFRVGERWRGSGAGDAGLPGGVEGALAAAAVAVAEGRLAGAADALEAGVAGTAAAAAVAGWVADARERQRLELALTVLRSHSSAIAASLA
jgi:mitofilin